MKTVFKKTYNYFLRITSHLSKREYSLAFYNIFINFPRWFLRYNKAIILENDITSMKVPEHLNPAVKVEIATLNDVEKISNVSNWERYRVEALLKRGGICFLASLDENPPAALTWLAFGRCFVKGMAYEFNFPKNSAYGVFSITLPEYRKKGLYLQMNHSIVEYSKKHGIGKYFVLVEFTNDYSLNLRNKLGFIRIFEITYLKFLFFKICIHKNISTKKRILKYYVRDPKGDITII